MGKLRAAKVRVLSEPGRYDDSQTLYLNVGPNGAKSRIHRLAIGGKRHDIGLAHL